MSKKRIATIYDFAKFCEGMKNCRKCPLSNYNNGENELCAEFKINHTDKVNEIILKWCDGNPVKTYKQDFLEKFPKARLDANGTPNGSCVDFIYNTITECDSDCDKCWNRPMKGSDE